jgi:hypothetical protein
MLDKRTEAEGVLLYESAVAETAELERVYRRGVEVEVAVRRLPEGVGAKRLRTEAGTERRTSREWREQHGRLRKDVEWNRREARETGTAEDRGNTAIESAKIDRNHLERTSEQQRVDQG